MTQAEKAGRIVILDDNNLCFELLREMFADYDIVGCRGPFEFVDALAREPSLILMDVDLPGLPATKIAALARGRTGQAPIVFFSDAPEDVLENLANSAGVDGFVSKRLDGLAVASAIRAFLATGQSRNTTAMPTSPVSRHDDELRVLLIDDSEIALLAEEHALRCAGFDVRATQSLGEFNNLLDNWTPHIVLTDVQMPEISGDELCRRLKAKIPGRVPIVLLSDLPLSTLEPLARAAGADGFLSKSRGLEHLVEQVKVLGILAYSPESVPR